MAPRQAFVSLLGLSLASCGFGLSGYGEYTQSGTLPPDYYSYDTPPATDLGFCTAEPVDLAGDTASDLTGTWQDWQGGSLEVVEFTGDGSVRMWLPAGAAAWVDPSADATGDSAADAGQPPPPSAGRAIDDKRALPAGRHSLGFISKVDTGGSGNPTLGRFVADASAGTVTITWGDGAKETLAVIFVSYPGCTMVTLSSDSPDSSRLPGVNGQLERVSCSPETTRPGGNLAVDAL